MSTKYTLEEHGFEILKNVFPVEKLVPYREFIDNIIAYGEKNLEDPFSKYYMRHRTDQGVLYDIFQRHPEFRELAQHPAILDKVAEVVGNDILLYENSLVYKPKGKDNEVPWHQDFINRPTEPLKYMSWIPFDDVTVENGAMKCIPGSHKKGFLPFYQVPGQTHHTRLDTSSLDLNNFLHLELNAGDVLIFNQLLVHSSDRVSSPKPRRAFRVSYQGFQQVLSPRATPLVLRGGSPSVMAVRFPKSQAEAPENQPPPGNKITRIARKYLRKLGKKLQSI